MLVQGCNEFESCWIVSLFLVQKTIGSLVIFFSIFMGTKH